MLLLLHQRQRVGERRAGMDGERIDHHAGLEFLDLAHLGGLLVRLEVAVDDADAAGLRHGDRHLYSVTVSMAEAMIGMLSDIERVMWVRISTSDGSTSDRPGLSSTSSKVNASGRELPIAAITNSSSPGLPGSCGPT